MVANGRVELMESWVERRLAVSSIVRLSAYVVSPSVYLSFAAAKIFKNKVAEP